jgi:hypothetical protein
MTGFDAKLTEECGLPTVDLPNGTRFITISAVEAHQIADVFRAAAHRHDEIQRESGTELDKAAAREMNAEYIERERGAA